jgi:heme-degrading monooxygenase HmoA
MIVKISSAIMPQSLFDPYLNRVQATTIPTYKAATGLISVSVFRRLVSGYVELLTLTVWQSEQALTRFLQSCPPIKKFSNDNGVIHLEPHVYELVASGKGIPRAAESSQTG